MASSRDDWFHSPFKTIQKSEEATSSLTPFSEIATLSSTPPISDGKQEEDEEIIDGLVYHFGDPSAPTQKNRHGNQSLSPKRRSSTFTRNEKEYHCVQVIGSGSDNVARLFKNDEGHSLVVRHPRNSYQNNPEEVNVDHKNAHYEMRFFSIANPSAFAHITEIKQQTNGSNKYTWREIYENLGEETLYDFFDSEFSAIELYQVLLNTAVLLNEMHKITDDKKGMIHGDIHASNIVLDQNRRPSFIDFGHSAYLGDIRWDSMHPGNLHLGKHFPPEMRGEENPGIRAMANQDIHQFIFMIKRQLIEKNRLPTDCTSMPFVIQKISDRIRCKSPSQRILLSRIRCSLENALKEAVIADELKFTDEPVIISDIDIREKLNYFSPSFQNTLIECLRTSYIKTEQLATLSEEDACLLQASEEMIVKKGLETRDATLLRFKWLHERLKNVDSLSETCNQETFDVFFEKNGPGQRPKARLRNIMFQNTFINNSPQEEAKSPSP